MKKYSKLLSGFIIMGVIFYAAYSFYYRNNLPNLVSQQPPTSENSQPKSINKQQIAPEIMLNDLNGHPVKLSDYKGQVVILNFWASWCPPCKAEMPDLNRTAIELAKAEDGVLLTVNLTDGVRETVDKASQYIKDNNYSMLVLMDTESKAANDYRIVNIPSTFIIDKEGVIYDVIVGPTTEKALLDYVNKLR